MTSLFYIEHANGKVSDQSLKAITAASQIEGDVHGLIVGSNIDEYDDMINIDAII